MKRMKRLLTTLLVVLLMIGICLCFAGCGVDPYYLDTWYLVSYADENGNSNGVGYDDITATHLYSDDITIQYFEDKTFIFKEFDKEYKGTYTYKNGRKETSVSLTFSDGTKGKGTCAKYMFDGVWYVGMLEAFGKEYNFSEEWEERYNRDTRSYTQVGENILYMLKKGETKNSYFSGYTTLYKGVVELRGEEYWFVPCNVDDIKEQNLSQAYELYTYEVAEDYSVQQGDNTLRAGECFFNYDFYKVALDSGDFETRDRYAIWFYEDVFRKIYPWTLDLEQEDILSIRAEYREKGFRSYYNTQIWGQGSEQLKEFYELFLSNNIVASVPPLVSVGCTMTYYIKAADQTHTVVLQNGWTENDFCQGFVVDGNFYRIYAEKQLNTYLDGDPYYALEKNEEGAKFFIGDEYVKSYNDLLDKILFTFDFYYEETSSDYVLTFGENTLIVLDEKHFIWQNPNYGHHYCEIVSDFDFSQVFEEYPRAE